MKSAKPLGYTDAEWLKTLKNTQNEDVWDAAVFDLIKKGPTVSGSTITKAAPLNIPDSVRIQFDYWRTQRNVCAHYKVDPFLRAHVEAFYGFISHWLLKISGKGGLAAMIEKLEDFCDPSKTPDNADLNPVIDAIPQYVSPAEYTEFLKNGIKVFAHSYRRDPIDFVISILGRNHGHFVNIRSEMLAIIRSKDRLRRWLLEKDARYVLDIYETPDEIRTFWYDEIHDLSSNRLNVIAILLEAGKIPEDQKEEAFSRILSNMKSQDRGLDNSSEETIAVLLRNGYFDQFVNTYLTPEEMNSTYASQLSQWCYKTNFFITHLVKANMSKDLIDRLLDCFGSGKNVPYTIQDRLRDELWRDNQYQFKDRFVKIARENGMNIPDNWIK